MNQALQSHALVSLPAGDDAAAAHREVRAADTHREAPPLHAEPQALEPQRHALVLTVGAALQVLYGGPGPLGK